MKLATFSHQGTVSTGIVIGDRVIESGVPGGMTALIAQWDSLRAGLEATAADGGGVPLADVTLHAPVPRPGKTFAIGLNYRDHIEETGATPPARQVWFTKAQTAINGPYDPIRIARGSTMVDYEVEMVAVIGKGGRYIPAERAAEAVFGYCVGNDVSERFWQRASPQWALGKSFDTHAPTGPWITSADELGDPHTLGLRCLVNGELRQSSNTANLLFSLWEQIEHLSSAMTLEPGDLLFTGTPGGVGMAMDPPCFLQAGDVVRCEIDRLGAIEASMVADA